MSVASLELCKELFRLSGWETGTTGFCWYDGMIVFGKATSEEHTYLPAYDLGYLLTALPQHIMINGEARNLHLFVHLEFWCASYGGKWGGKLNLSFKSKSPEDALCKLAIELFKQGYLMNDDQTEEAQDQIDHDADMWEANGEAERADTDE